MPSPTPHRLPTETPRPDFSRGSNGLLPAIAQDVQTNQVLMMAWMNAAAFEETMETGYATYFSRSRDRLWRKGEESGHRQRVEAVRLDCDADSILLLVEQTGPACHEGYASCFFREYRQGELVIIDLPLKDPKSIYKL